MNRECSDIRAPILIPREQKGIDVAARIPFTQGRIGTLSQYTGQEFLLRKARPVGGVRLELRVEG